MHLLQRFAQPRSTPCPGADATTTSNSSALNSANAAAAGSWSCGVVGLRLDSNEYVLCATLVPCPQSLVHSHSDTNATVHSSAAEHEQSTRFLCLLTRWRLLLIAPPGFNTHANSCMPMQRQSQSPSQQQQDQHALLRPLVQIPTKAQTQSMALAHQREQQRAQQQALLTQQAQCARVWSELWLSTAVSAAVTVNTSANSCDENYAANSRFSASSGATGALLGELRAVPTKSHTRSSNLKNMHSSPGSCASSESRVDLSHGKASSDLAGIQSSRLTPNNIVPTLQRK